MSSEGAHRAGAAVRRSQEAIWSAALGPRTQAQQAAWDLAKAHRAHPDHRQGPKAFVERRPPRWSP